MFTNSRCVCVGLNEAVPPAAVCEDRRSSFSIEGFSRCGGQRWPELLISAKPRRLWWWRRRQGKPPSPELDACLPKLTVTFATRSSRRLDGAYPYGELHRGHIRG